MCELSRKKEERVCLNRTHGGTFPGNQAEAGLLSKILQEWVKVGSRDRVWSRASCLVKKGPFTEPTAQGGIIIMPLLHTRKQGLREITYSAQS